MSGWLRQGCWHEGWLLSRLPAGDADRPPGRSTRRLRRRRGSVSVAAALMGVRPSTVKRHLADLPARSGLTTEQLIYRGRADGWLVVAELEPSSDREDPAALWMPSRTRSSPYSNSSP